MQQLIILGRTGGQVLLNTTKNGGLIFKEIFFNLDNFLNYFSDEPKL